MSSRFEDRLKRDIDQIRSTVSKMGVWAEGALRASLLALTESDRQLAYSIILRDRYIDELEKEVDRLLRIFARYIYPRVPDVTLTLVGDGPEHEALQALAKELGVDHRTYFVGEQSLHEMPDWYRNADLFVYTSLSETYGQVVSEALWCGLPVVAMQDGMGVAGQVSDGDDGFLIDPKANDADEDFGRRVRLLLEKPALRAQMCANAVRNAKLRSDPEACVQRYLEVFEVAKDRARQNPARSSTRSYGILASWTALHAAYGALGALRKPSGMNRNEAPAGSWTLATA